MPITVEWDEVLPSPDGPAPATPRRRPVRGARTRGALLALVAAASIAAWAAAVHPVVTSGRGRSGAALLADQQQLAEIRSAATAALPTFVRPDAPRGGCAVVTPGQPPQQRVEAAVRAVLAAYRPGETGRTLDEYGGLCSLTVRERDRTGSVLVIVVGASTSTSTRSGLEQPSLITSRGAVSVSMARLTTADGWTVTVGAVGPSSDQPPPAALLALVRSPALRW